MVAEVVFHSRPEQFKIDGVRGHFQSFRPFFPCKPLKFLRRAETYGVHVDTDGPCHPAPSAFPHASPVLERVAYQCVRRHCHYGFVPVADFDGVEGHFLDFTVDSVLVHHDPVSRAQHVVRGKLHACYQAEDSVFENEHQHRRRRTQSGNEGREVFFQEYAYHKDRAYTDDYDLEHLVDAFHRLVFQRFGFIRNGIQ